MVVGEYASNTINSLLRKVYQVISTSPPSLQGIDKGIIVEGPNSIELISMKALQQKFLDKF
jgi:hypothetical protein